MSLSVDQARYFIPSYAAQSLTPVGETIATTDDAVDASADDGPTVAPPPMPASQLLADSDIRLLIMRGMKNDGVEDYAAILEEFYSDPANQDDPVAFLQNLSSDGVEFLRKAQSIGAATQIDVSSLSKEEALNFILPQSEKVDLDNDGLVAGAGGGKTFMFPPPNAPQSVKDAWNEATDGMSESDVFLMTGKFMMQFAFANFHIDDNGNVHRADPGDPDWRNIFAEDGYSYQNAIDEFQAGNEFSRPDNTPEMYERIKSLLARLDDTFASHGIT